MDIAIRPGTRADFESWYQQRPEKACRLWVATIDGEVVCVAGYSMEDGCLYAFSGVKPDLPVSRREILYWAGKLFEEMKKAGLPLIAKAEPLLPNSGRFLEKLGFHLVRPAEDGDVYQWNSSP